MSRIILLQKKWNIELDFLDLNQLGPRWKSRCDYERYLDILTRIIIYKS